MLASRVLVVASLLVASTRAYAGPAGADADPGAPAAAVPATTTPATSASLAAPAATHASPRAHRWLVAPLVDDPALGRLGDPELELDHDLGEPDGRPARVGTTRSRAIAMATTGGVYAGLYGWLTLAWYVRTTDSGEFITQDEGWFGSDTYAGGSDKLGHAWGNYFLVRGINQILKRGGWSETASLATSSALAFSFFTMSEIKDGYKKEFGFSYGDMIMNTAGNLFGIVMEKWPALDRRIDWRISYLPSDDYKRALEKEGPFNTPEDYTGQQFLLAYHLGSNEFLSGYTKWTKYVDLSVGYSAVNYKPEPKDGSLRRQDLYVGLSLNLQGVVDAFTTKGTASAGALHFLTEMYQAPYTTLRVGGLDRTAPQPPAASALDPMNNASMQK